MMPGPGAACSILQRDARALFQEALRRCSTERALAAKLHTGEADRCDADRVALSMRGVCRLLLIAIGKGSPAMLAALLARKDIVGGRELRGVLVAPERPTLLPSSIEYIRGAHPLPDSDSRRAAEIILKLLQDEPPGDKTLCLFLISGGASAMVELPLDRSIGVEDTAAFHRALVHSGAPIVEINALRKHFSAVKGGRLALAARHLRTLSLLMSDVPSGELDALGSGPTLPDRSTVADCRRILQRDTLRGQLPPSVAQFFADPMLPETPKPGELEARSLLLLDAADLARAAAAAAAERGYTPVIDNTPDDWPVAQAAEYLLERFRTLRREHGRVCLISTGEVTVVVPPAFQITSRGGRNQHFVLACATRLTHNDGAVAVLSCGSDGIDGNSTAAGGVIASADFQTREAQLEARETLACFDSNSLLRRLGCAIETGPTGINLRDLRILLG